MSVGALCRFFETSNGGTAVDVEEYIAETNRPCPRTKWSWREQTWWRRWQDGALLKFDDAEVAEDLRYRGAAADVEEHIARRRIAHALGGGGGG